MANRTADTAETVAVVGFAAASTVLAFGYMLFAAGRTAVTRLIIAPRRNPASQ